MEAKATEKLAELGAIAVMFKPLTGTVLITRAERAGKALGELASRNERIGRALLAFLSMLDLADGPEVGFEIFVAHGIERERIAKDSLMTFPIRDVIEQYPDVGITGRELAERRSGAIPDAAAV